MNEVMRVSAPVRIDISACWPDSGRYRKEFGGFLLSGAIDKRVATIIDGDQFITSMEDIPPNSGLGPAAAIRATLIVASNPTLTETCSLSDLVNKVFLFENEILGQVAGVQDQAAAFAGGVNLWEFTSGGAIRQFPILRDKFTHLQDRLVIIYTGEKRQSSDIHQRVFNPRYYDHNVSLFDEMSELAKLMAQHIDDEERMVELIREARRLHKEPYDGVETDVMRNIAQALDGFHSAWKAVGAGGGGCMIFYTSTPSELGERFTKEKEKRSFPKDSRVISFKFEMEGLKIHRC